MRPALPAEFQLMAACCRWPPSPAREAAVAAAASAPIEWACFERILARHRVAALAHDGLRRAGVAVPPPTARRLADAAAAAGRKALAMARETLRLQRTFDDAGIRAVFVKGSSLAALAYGDLGLKQAWDIDFLTTAENAPAARTLLERLGYALFDPQCEDEALFARAILFAKECIFLNPSLDIAVELHWRLVDNPLLLAGVDAFASTRQVQIGDGEVRTLADEALFAFLCAHGTLHAWSRFKWLADVGAYLSRSGDAAIEPLYRAALGLGAGRSPAIALLLCHRLLALAVPPPLLDELRADRVTRAIESSTLRCMTYRGGASEIPYFSGAILQMTLTRLFIVPGGRYLRSEIAFKWNSPEDRIRLGLPGSLSFLYHVLRLPLWLGRFGRRLLGKA